MMIPNLVCSTLDYICQFGNEIVVLLDQCGGTRLWASKNLLYIVDSLICSLQFLLLLGSQHGMVRYKYINVLCCIEFYQEKSKQ